MKSVFAFLFASLTFVQFGFGQWNHITSGSQYSLSFVKIDEPSGVCIAGGTEFLKSLDNGVTWTNYGTSASFLNIYSVSGVVILSPTNFILTHNTSTGRRISRTTNGGTSWTNVHSGNGAFHDIAYNGSVLLAVGSVGVIYKSTNGGTTWSLVPSGTTQRLNTVEWDPNQNSWIIGGNLRRLTFNGSDPTSFTTTTINHEITDLSFRNGKLIEIRKYSSNESIVEFDLSGSIVSETFNNISTSNSGYFLSANKIITNSLYHFYETHPLDNLIYQYVDTLTDYTNTQGTEIYDMDFCGSYGLAVGPNGALAKYDINETPELIASPEFLINTTQNCPGAIFTATPISIGADQYEWYVDNQFVSNDDTLFYPQPLSSGYHPIKLILTYNGHHTEFNSQVYTIPPLANPQYNIVADTTLCYLEQAVFHLNGSTPSNSPWNVQILQNGNVVTGPFSVVGNAAINSLQLTASGDLQVQLFAIGACDTFYVTEDFHFTVGPNLGALTVFSGDTAICQLNDSQIDLSITNTVPGASYQFFYPQNSPPLAYIIGSGTDTINFSFSGNNFYPWGPWGSDEYQYYEYPNGSYQLFFSASYQGCSIASHPFHTFDVVYTDAYFDFTHHTTQVGDTMNIANHHGGDYFNWSIDEPVFLSQNLNDSIPLFISNIPGKYNVNLVSESRYGCIDSTSRTHKVALPINMDDHSLSFAKKLPTMRIIGTKVSPNGSYYEYGYYGVCCPDNTSFCLRKLDENGQLLWEKRPPIVYGKTHVISSIDIDENENVYATFYLEDELNFELINYDGGMGWNWSYLVKWDSTGQMLIAKKFTYQLLTDILVQNNQLHIASLHNVYTTDLDFNLIHTSNINGVQDGILNPGYGSYEMSLNDWAWVPRYPKLAKLKNGNIIMIGYGSSIYSYTITLDNLPPVYTEFPFSPSSASDYIYAAIYDPINGFTSLKKITETSTGLGFNDVSVDEENNVYILTHASSNENNQIDFFDSLFMMPPDYGLGTSYLIKLNSALNPIWIKESSVINGSLNYSFPNQELILSGQVHSDFYIGSNTEFQSINCVNQSGTTGYPYSDQIYYHMIYEPMMAFIDKNGLAIKGQTFERVSSASGYAANISTNNAVNRCGDLYLSHQDHTLNSFSVPPYTYTPYSNQFVVDSTIYAADSNLLFKFPAQNPQCTYLILSDNSYQTSCSTDTNFQIPIYVSNNIDTVAYLTLLNGTPIAEGLFPIEANFIQAHLPTMNLDYSIVLMDPADLSIIDTITTRIVSPIMPLNTNYFFAPCEEFFTLTVDPNTFSSVLWKLNDLGSVHQANSNDFYGSPYLQDSANLYYAVSAFDSNGCFVNFPFEIQYDCFPNYQISQEYTYCSITNSVQIPVTITNTLTPPNTINYEVWQGGNYLGAGTAPINNGFISLDLQQTNTEYTIVFFTDYTDVIDTITLQVVHPIQPLQQSVYSLPCSRELILAINPQLFSNAVWQFNGIASTQNNVYSIDFTDSAFDQLDSNTTYTFEVSAIDLNGCNTSQIYQIQFCSDTSLSISNINNNTFSLFPNPALEKIELATNSSYETLKASIVDLNGRTITFSTFLKNEALTFDVSNLASGYYMLHVTIDQSNEPTIIPFIKKE